MRLNGFAALLQNVCTLLYAAKAKNILTLAAQRYIESTQTRQVNSK